LRQAYAGRWRDSCNAGESGTLRRILPQPRLTYDPLALRSSTDPAFRCAPRPSSSVRRAPYLPHESVFCALLTAAADSHSSPGGPRPLGQSTEGVHQRPPASCQRRAGPRRARQIIVVGGCTVETSMKSCPGSARHENMQIRDCVASNGSAICAPLIRSARYCTVMVPTMDG
jgi:hypothetical protein